MLVIGDIRAAKDILDKQAAKFSSRPSILYVVRLQNYIYNGWHSLSVTFNRENISILMERTGASTVRLRTSTPGED